MKNINLKSKKGIILGMIFLFIILFLIIILNKGLKEKALNILGEKKESLIDTVSDNDYEKFSGEIVAYFEGKWILSFSFLHKKDLKIEQGKGEESRWFRVLDSENKNKIIIYFTYEGGRGWKAEDYINNITNGQKDLKILDVRFLDNSTSSIKYISMEDKNLEYFIEEVKNEKGEPWLVIVENTDAKDEVSQNVTRDIIRSFEGK